MLDTTKYDKDVIDRLVEIDREIKEQVGNEKVNKEKLTKLYCAQLMRGLELNYNKDFQGYF